MADTRGRRFHTGTLAANLDAREGCQVTVLIKDGGPIAAMHGGVQYSLAVPLARKKEVDLRDFLPKEPESSPQAGVISNTSFLLHVSEEKWEKVILPALRARFGG